MQGTILLPSALQFSGLSDDWMRLPFSPSAGPVNARRQVPPYLPISSSGCQTIGSAGTRCSTGGSFPALTSSASIGASENFFGHFAGSAIMVGPWTSPTRPDCDRLVWASAIALRRNVMAAGLAAMLASAARRDNKALGMGVSPQQSVAAQSSRGDRQSKTVPPSTEIVCPVTKLLPSEISQAMVPVRSEGSSVR